VCDHHHYHHEKSTARICARYAYSKIVQSVTLTLAERDSNRAKSTYRDELFEIAKAGVTAMMTLVYMLRVSDTVFSFFELLFDV
jgi:hypothetical protein